MRNPRGERAPRTWGRAGMGRGKRGSVEACDLTTRAAPDRLPNREIDRLVDEPNGPVGHADVGPVDVVAGGGDVGPAERRVAAVVLLRRRGRLLLVPVDRQRVRVERVVVDAAA